MKPAWPYFGAKTAAPAGASSSAATRATIPPSSRPDGPSIRGAAAGSGYSHTAARSRETLWASPACTDTAPMLC